MKSLPAPLLLSLGVLSLCAASATDVQLRPATPEVEAALRAALKALGTEGVTLNLVTTGGPAVRSGGGPAFNPDEGSRSGTRGGENFVELNPQSPLPQTEVLRRELLRVLGLPENATSQALLARYGGADLNADGNIDLADLAILSGNFGKRQAGLRGDLNGDGQVNAADVQLFAKSYKLP